MSFFDTLKQFGLWPQQGGQGGQPQANPYGLDEGQMRQARMQSLSNLGSQIMAASVQQTPRQRAELMSGFDMTGGYQNNLYNAAQMKLLSDRQRAAQEGDERDGAAKAWLQQKIGTMPDSIQKRNAMIYLQLGDVQKAAEMLTAGAAQPEYQIVDGYYVNKNDPNAPAVPIQGYEKPGEAVNPKDRLPFVAAYENDPQVQGYNVMASTLGSLTGAVYDDSKVSDLEYIYGIAKALDPTSVVRESEAGMVLEAQGLDEATLGRLNGMLGGGTLSPTQRIELLALVRRRAQSLEPFVKSKREYILRVGQGVIDDSMMRPIAPLAPNPAPPPPRPQTVAPGRSSPPEPELIGVQD
jgi:hypothetical protein